MKFSPEGEGINPTQIATLNALSGIIACQGEVLFQGKKINGLPPHKIVQRGITHVPEGRGIFGNLSVRENLTLATWQSKRKIDFEYVFSLFPRLKERKNQLGESLSGGEQQMLAIARALMSQGQLLLLDEPSMGLSPILEAEIFALLSRLNKEGTTILLVEQNAQMALRLATRGYVIEAGCIIAEGSGKELLNSPQVKKAYLGD